MANSFKEVRITPTASAFINAAHFPLLMESVLFNTLKVEVFAQFANPTWHTQRQTDTNTSINRLAVV